MDGTFVSRVITTDSNGWNAIYGMHRADLLRILAGGLPSTAIRSGHRCIGFEQSAYFAQVKFATGQIDRADAVIAADGIQSSLQKYVVEPSTPEYSGSHAYRGLIPRGRDSAEISDVLRRYEAFRRERTDVVQAEARKQGLRLDSRSGSLQQRDQDIARHAEFRKWLYDYDVEKAAIAYLTKCGKLARA